MDWKKAKYIDDNKYDLPGNWLKIEYFEALNLLFRIENALRVFTYIILKSEYQDKWKSLSINSDDEKATTIGAIAKKRLIQDKNYAYLGFIMTNPLIHLTSGELIGVITSDSYWKHFKSYFLGSKTIMKTKLDEISNVRNALAHFRPISPDDVELVKQNSLHTLTKIERSIYQFVTCTDIVPTNTDEEWYSQLKALNTDEVKFSFRQSKDEQWANVTLHFELPVINRTGDGKSYYHMRTMNLISDKLLILFPELTKYVISATENLPSAYTENPKTNRLFKSIELTFSRESLRENCSIVKSEFENLLVQIKKEIELIREDNLARGELVEVVSCYYELYNAEKKFYKFDGKQFRTEVTENTPEEFWGVSGFFTVNYISDTEDFPWMPVKVSEDLELPF